VLITVDQPGGILGPSKGERGEELNMSHTGVDKLLLGGVPSFFLLDFLFDLANLKLVIRSRRTCRRGASVGWEWSHTVSDGSASITNFCCLRS
jgi:hypothetical protein